MQAHRNDIGPRVLSLPNDDREHAATAIASYMVRGPRESPGARFIYLLVHSPGAFCRSVRSRWYSDPTLRGAALGGVEMQGGLGDSSQATLILHRAFEPRKLVCEWPFSQRPSDGSYIDYAFFQLPLAHRTPFEVCAATGLPPPCKALWDRRTHEIEEKRKARPLLRSGAAAAPATTATRARNV